ncbi:MAG: Asp-tRNA(Asn)/Glu-tRNA(Gln) amidotransferase subunit GatC, partial [Planctomycetota bacterium]
AVIDENTTQSDPPCLSGDEVRALAALSRLSPSPEQVDRLCRDLGAVLGYAECLARAPLEDVEPMARPVDEVNKLDEDVPGPTLDRSVLGGMAPDFDGAFIGVPKVIDGGPSSGGES